MNTGAPIPSVFCAEGKLLCAYYVGVKANKPKGTSTVLVFEGVQEFRFGCYYNHENLTSHPLYKHGLRCYKFVSVENSPLIAELYSQRGKSSGLQHWIITFHDETLDVLGHKASVIGDMIASPDEALRVVTKKWWGSDPVDPSSVVRL